MVSGIILLESSLLAGKKAEAVIGLTGPWRLGRVKNQWGVADGGLLAQPDVFPSQGKQEGLPAVPVCDGMEYIQHYALAVSHYLEQETTVEAEAAHTYSGVLGHNRHLLEGSQIPPEETVPESASESRDTLDGVHQSLLENVDIDRVGKSNAEPVD